jgi:hypothetical protein
MCAEGLANPALHEVAHDGGAHAPAHGQPEPRRLPPLRTRSPLGRDQEHEAARPTALTLARHARVVPPAPQAIRAPQTALPRPHFRHAVAYLEAMVTTRRFRPFARRRFRTARPFFVAMRARNPWVRLRFSRLG